MFRKAFSKRLVPLERFLWSLDVRNHICTEQSFMLNFHLNPRACPDLRNRRTTAENPCMQNNFTNTRPLFFWYQQVRSDEIFRFWAMAAALSARPHRCSSCNARTRTKYALACLTRNAETRSWSQLFETSAVHVSRWSAPAVNISAAVRTSKNS